MSANPQIPDMPTVPGGRCVTHLADGSSYAFHCDTNQPYTSTPPACQPVEGRTEQPDTCIPVLPPPSACLPELEESDCHPVLNPSTTVAARTGELPRTGGETEPLLGVAGFLIIVGVPLVLVASWRRWKENRHLDGLARLEAETRRNGKGVA